MRDDTTSAPTRMAVIPGRISNRVVIIVWRILNPHTAVGENVKWRSHLTVPFLKIKYRVIMRALAFSTPTYLHRELKMCVQSSRFIVALFIVKSGIVKVHQLMNG